MLTNFHGNEAKKILNDRHKKTVFFNHLPTSSTVYLHDLDLSWKKWEKGKGVVYCMIKDVLFFMILMITSF